ncbi:MAG: hypothetical protein ABL877_10220 [Thiobacillus sp.]
MIDAVIEFMTSYHKGGRHGGYGWMYFLLAAFLIGGAFSARELVERRKRLLIDTEIELASESLTAAVMVEQDNGPRFLTSIS